MVLLTSQLMITVDSYFGETIQNALLNEIGMAKKSIHVAVAWFTDITLFDALLQQQSKGVSIQLCVVNDQINFKPGGIVFTNLNSGLSEFTSVDSSKMHHKFCVIDDSIVITGSYNWTFAAAHLGKDENIIVTTGDIELANKFIEEFYKVVGKPRAYYVIDDLSRIIKRMKALQSLIQLEEIDDIHKQAIRLQNESGNNERVKSIADQLLKNKFSSAIKEIDGFLISYSQLQSYVDPEVDALKLEIRMLEYQIVALENEKADCEKIVLEYERLFNIVLGDIVKEILFVKKEIKQKQKEEGKITEDEYGEAETEYEEYEQSYEQTKEQAKDFVTLSEEENVELKKLYKTTTLLCHPDKFENEPEKQKQAEEIFKDLNRAYRNQDIETVRYIYENLKKGIFNLKSSQNDILDLKLLQHKKEYLQLQHIKLLNECNQIKSSDAYAIVKKEENLESYFANIKLQLEIELHILKDEIKIYEQR